ncbi:MAG: hypothetical protein H0X36_00005 [Sphingomonadaceae bacterium]|nr:hypothetical protein [Sphingomonadaceae bacterium]
MTDTKDQEADAAAVSTERNPATHPNQHAMQDESINKRLEDHPEDSDARLDAGLDQSMDASDPPSSTQPVHSTDPAPSSGFDEKAEEKLRTK